MKIRKNLIRSIAMAAVIVTGHCIDLLGGIEDPDGSGLGFCFGGGLGTREEPLTLCSYESFRKIRTRENWQNQHYLMGGDIDATPSWRENSTGAPCIPFDGTTAGGGSDCTGFTPFDLNGGEFNGTFDGGGYAIYNLFIDVPPYSPPSGYFSDLSAAIFNHGAIGREGRIRNLGIVDIRVRRGINTAVLAAENRGGRIQNVYVLDRPGNGTGGFAVDGSGDEIGSGNSRSVFVVRNRLGGIIQNSFAIMNSTGKSAFVGSNDVGSVVQDCYAGGNLTVSGSGGRGLVVGDLGGRLTNVYSTGDASHRTRTGNIAGQATGRNWDISGDNYYFSLNKAGGQNGVGDGLHCNRGQTYCGPPPTELSVFFDLISDSTDYFSESLDGNLDQYINPDLAGLQTRFRAAAEEGVRARVKAEMLKYILSSTKTMPSSARRFFRVDWDPISGLRMGSPYTTPHTYHLFRNLMFKVGVSTFGLGYAVLIPAPGSSGRLTINDGSAFFFNGVDSAIPYNFSDDPAVIARRGLLLPNLVRGVGGGRNDTRLRSVRPPSLPDSDELEAFFSEEIPDPLPPEDMSPLTPDITCDATPPPPMPPTLPFCGCQAAPCERVSNSERVNCLCRQPDNLPTCLRVNVSGLLWYHLMYVTATQSPPGDPVWIPD